MASDDADLMRRWQRGDGRAFEALVGRWQQPVARFVHRITGRADLVPDLCQEVFLRLFQAGPRYRESGGFPHGQPAQFVDSSQGYFRELEL